MVTFLSLTFLVLCKHFLSSNRFYDQFVLHTLCDFLCGIEHLYFDTVGTYQLRLTFF